MCISPSSSSPTALFSISSEGRERGLQNPPPQEHRVAAAILLSSFPLFLVSHRQGCWRRGGRGERRRKTMTPLGGEGRRRGGGLGRGRGGKMLLPVARHLYCRIRILENIAIFFLENYASKICERVRAPKVRRGGKRERAEGGEVGFFLSSPLSLSLLLLSDLAKLGESWLVGR